MQMLKKIRRYEHQKHQHCHLDGVMQMLYHFEWICLFWCVIVYSLISVSSVNHLTVQSNFINDAANVFLAVSMVFGGSVEAYCKSVPSSCSRCNKCPAEIQEGSRCCNKTKESHGPFG